MKIGGVEVTKCEDLLVLPRSNADDIPIRAEAVTINDEFNEKVPLPIAPLIQKKDGNHKDFKDKNYVKAISNREDQRFDFLCIKSLAPSNIEWETVDLDKPNTWCKWREELMNAGISEQEINRIIETIMVANALNERKIQAARDAFLRGQGA